MLCDHRAVSHQTIILHMTEWPWTSSVNASEKSDGSWQFQDYIIWYFHENNDFFMCCVIESLYTFSCRDSWAVGAWDLNTEYHIVTNTFGLDVQTSSWLFDVALSKGNWFHIKCMKNKKSKKAIQSSRSKFHSSELFWLILISHIHYGLSANNNIFPIFSLSSTGIGRA